MIISSLLAGCDKHPTTTSNTTFAGTLQDIIDDIAPPELITSTINHLDLKTISCDSIPIIWNSSDERIINHYGDVYHTVHNQEVTLTADILYDGSIHSEDFAITVTPSGKIDFKDIHYGLKGEFDETAQTVEGELIITFTSNIEEELEEIHFNLYTFLYEKYNGSAKGRIVISSVEENDQALVFNQSRYTLKIVLLDSLSPQETKTLVLKFIVNVPTGTERLGCYSKTCSITQWYPILSKYNPETKAWNLGDYPKDGESDYIVNSQFDLEFTYPSKNIGASSGIDEPEEEKAGTKTLRSHLENGRHMVVIFGENLSVYESQGQNGKIRYFYNKLVTTTNLIKKFEAGFNDAVTFFVDKVGAFSYTDEFDVIETGVVGFAMEYSGLIQMGSYFNYNDTAAYPKDYSTLVHELGHQWFYGKIGSDSGADPFIDEGFTSFITAYYFSNLNPSSLYGLEQNKSDYMIYSRYYVPMIPIGDPMSTFDKLSSTYLSLSVYYGTTALLYEMMTVLGADKIDLLLKGIADLYSYELMTRNELFLLIQDIFSIEARQAFEACLVNVYNVGDFQTEYKALLT